MDCSLQGSLLRPWNFPGNSTGVGFHFPFSRGSSRPWDRTCVLPHCGQTLYRLSTREDPRLFVSRQPSALRNQLSRPPLHTTFPRLFFDTLLYQTQTVGFGVRALSSPARRFHSNQLTTSRARLEKSSLGLGLRRNSSSRLPSTPPPTATPSALLRVFTVLTLALNSSVMSTAMATRAHRCPTKPAHVSSRRPRRDDPAAGGPFRCPHPSARQQRREKNRSEQSGAAAERGERFRPSAAGVNRFPRRRSHQLQFPLPANLGGLGCARKGPGVPSSPRPLAAFRPQELGDREAGSLLVAPGIA